MKLENYISDKKVSVSFTIEQSILDKLNNLQVNRSQLVNDLLKEFLQKVKVEERK